MSETRHKKRYRKEQKEPIQGRAMVAYEGPAPDAFFGGATGGGLGAVIGFLLGGPAGAAIGAALGAAIGGWLGAVSEEEKKNKRTD